MCEALPEGAVEELGVVTVKRQRDQVEVPWPYTERSVFLGRYCLKSLLVFSEVARCQGLLGSQK